MFYLNSMSYKWFSDKQERFTALMLNSYFVTLAGIHWISLLKIFNWKLIATEKLYPKFKNWLIHYEKYWKMLLKIIGSTKDFVFINTFLNFENTLISGFSKNKECFSKTWVTRQMLLHIFVRVYILHFVRLRNIYLYLHSIYYYKITSTTKPLSTSEKTKKLYFSVNLPWWI